MKKEYCDYCGVKITKEYDKCNNGAYFENVNNLKENYEIYIKLKSSEHGNDPDICKTCMFHLIHKAWTIFSKEKIK